MPNIIKIDRYNFELYRFKVGPFFWDTVYFRHRGVYLVFTLWKQQGLTTGNR